MEIRSPALDGKVEEVERKLRKDLEVDGKVPSPGYVLLRYDKELRLPWVQRNEVLIGIAEEG